MALLLNDDDMNRMLEEIRPVYRKGLGNHYGRNSQDPVPGRSFQRFLLCGRDRPFFGHCRYGNL